MSHRPFRQVDVFTNVPYLGNPVAVVLDGQGLSTVQMQQFAKWTNLTETTFVLPPTNPEADYFMRIFTPTRELPFAGHPTLGTCHAWLLAGGQPQDPARIVQETKIGLTSIRRRGERLAFSTPPLRRSAPSDDLYHLVLDALSLKPEDVLARQVLDNGPVWLGILLESVDAVLTLEPDHRKLKTLNQAVGVAALTELASSNTDSSYPAIPWRGTRVNLEVRCFISSIGVDEDPVTGSFNASAAQWLIEDGHLPNQYTAGQGQRLGRDGRVYVDRPSPGEFWIGGDSVVCVEGSVTL